jgi:hypothetical protein
VGFALTGLGPFFAKHSQGDALGFHMAPRWGLGHGPAGELGKGAAGGADLEPNGQTPRDEPRLPSPNGQTPRDEPRLPSPNGASCESPGHRPGFGP